MMSRMGFDNKWIGWIKGCIESTSVSVLVNGSQTPDFHTKKGLRQRDPLAPFLFLLVAEGLNGMMRQAVELNLFESFSVGSTGVEISLLQFADDTPFVGKPSMQIVLVMKSALRCFEIMSGLKVNFAKSKLAGISMERGETQRFAVMLNCLTMEVPFVYLGMQVGANPRKIISWEPVLQRLRKRLATWKNRSLSFGGKLCLLRSVLTSIPLFYLSFFKMSKSVAKECQKLQMKFLWGDGGDARKIAWVKWEKVCQPKEEGGLGVKDIEAFNNALLMKWRWRMLNEHGSLWLRVLKAKYGACNRALEPIIATNGSWWWQDLMRVCVRDVDLFAENVKIKVGDGGKTSFWHDRWAGEEGPLKQKFERLFSVSEFKDSKIFELGEWIEGSWRWKFTWRRLMFEWETQLFEELNRYLGNFQPMPNLDDKCIWKASLDGMFTVKSAYDLQLTPNQQANKEVFKKLWSLKVPSNIQAFSWRVFLDRIQTKANLMRRNIIQPDAACLCAFCSKMEENLSHLLFSCNFSWRVWMSCFQWLEICTVMEATPAAHFLQFG